MAESADKRVVLIVDDDESIVDLVRACLRERPFNILEAFDGKTGVQRAVESKADLVILDIMMPVMHGFEACQALRAKPELKGTKILVLTAKGYETDRRAILNLGADEYMVKPVEPKDLLAAVDRLLAGNGKH